MKTYYDILGISRDSTFAELKRAYYSHAKRCHPDLFRNSEEKNREFREIVDAFNLLSDPVRRREYDEKLNGLDAGIFAESGLEVSSVHRIMDTEADEILEELIVGNKPPEDATLMTLMRDLERTHVFMLWREARNYYAERRGKAALKLFEQLISMVPENILYRVHLARCHAMLRHDYKAKYHYRAAIRIGERRTPPQMLFAVKKELEYVSKRKNPLIRKICDFFFPPEQPLALPSDEQMIRETSRSMERLMKERDQKQLKGPSKN